MRKRIDLQKIFKEILGNNNVYYQTPTKLVYPCIKYERSSFDTEYANNKKYKKLTHYTVTFITSQADCEEILDKLNSLDYCTLNRQYVSDNLYHCVFDLYY